MYSTYIISTSCQPRTHSIGHFWPVRTLRKWLLSLLFDKARTCKRLKNPAIDSEESFLPGWESIPGLLKRFTNTSSVFYEAFVIPAFAMSRLDFSADRIFKIRLSAAIAMQPKILNFQTFRKKSLKSSTWLSSRTPLYVLQKDCQESKVRHIKKATQTDRVFNATFLLLLLPFSIQLAVPIRN